MGHIRIGVLVACWLWCSRASADGAFLGWELGGSSVSGLGDHIRDAPSLRLVGGFRSGDVGIVVSTGFEDPRGVFSDCDRGVCTSPDSTLADVSVDIKYAHALVGPLKLYGRGRVTHVEAGGVLGGYSGHGFGLGGGVQVDGKIRVLGLLVCPIFYFLPYGPKVHAAMYIDAGRDRFVLHRAGDPSLSAANERVTWGVAFGSDF